MFRLTQLKFYFKTKVTEWDIDGKAHGWNYCIPFIKIWHARECFDNVMEFQKYFILLILFFASILIKLIYLNDTVNKSYYNYLASLFISGCTFTS